MNHEANEHHEKGPPNEGAADASPKSVDSSARVEPVLPPVAPPVQALPTITPAAPGSEQAVPEHRDVARDEQGNIAEDVSCRECGYNLRGLAAEQVCPECSLPIEHSLRVDLLQFANPTWVRKLERGTLLIVIGQLISVGLGFVTGLAMVAISSLTASASGGGAAFSTPVIIAVSVASMMGILSELIIVYGAWLLSSPEPGTVQSPKVFTARRVLRFGMLAGVLAVPGNVLLSGSGARFNPATAGIGPIFGVMTLLSAVLSFVLAISYIAGFVHLRRLALRVPNQKLASQSRIVWWGLGISFGIGACIGVVMAILMPMIMSAQGLGGGAGGGPPGGVWVSIVIAGVGGCIGGVGQLVFGIWAIVLLFMYRSTFGKVYGIAVQNWGSPRADAYPDAQTLPSTDV